MATGKIGVTTENIFPVIKEFLYSDHDIFMRELVANAVDASLKMKTLAGTGDFKGEIGDLSVRIDVDAGAKTIRITDRGIGMNAEEIDKYINQIAFSSAGEFLDKYKEKAEGLIGHFGLGFYSSFMVSKQVTIESLSYREGSKAVKWSCDGTPEFTLEECDKSDRGTVITLYLDSDSEEYAEEAKVGGLLHKYCKFMPVPVVFGKQKEWKDDKYADTDKDNVINDCEPLWTRKPAELKDEDYLTFYNKLYPMQEDPLFHIHLNVDYPFNLTGILYFPKIKNNLDVSKNKIQLFCNQMFVTDSVENIVPEFLTLLHGVIDSPDIPLNVSRSYLQEDANVRKISGYITKKVAERLDEIAKNSREEYESKWDNLKLFIEYGMLTDQKFCDKAMNFALFKNTDGKYFKIEDYTKAVEAEQKDKGGKTVVLYCTDANAQYQFVENAKNCGYDVLVMDCPLDSHYVGLLESKLTDIVFKRVDSDSVGKLIEKAESEKYDISEKDRETVQKVLEEILPKENKYDVRVENLGENASPILITQSEFIRRYREMAAVSGGMNFYGELPDTYNITINAQNPVITKIAGEEGIVAVKADNELLKQVIDLALLANGLLKGKALSDFIRRSEDILNK